MGTRGLMAFARNGELKGMYNHFDSYPTGLGEDIINWMRDADLDVAAKQFDELQAVKEDEKPTKEQIDRLLQYADLQVGNQSLEDWYSLLRDTQGNPAETLKAGFYVDYIAFAGDSLFCEWAYVVDLDARTLEVYKGFQTTGDPKGRFADVEPATGGYNSAGYGPVTLVATYTLDELKTANIPDLLQGLEAEDED